jgi:hydroxymethylpyrimidine/phosphomethylpyrimidine kinase
MRTSFELTSLPVASELSIPPVVLVLGGMDPSGGAGLLADVQVINRHGCHALGVTTLETIQNTLGVQSVIPGDADRVYAQTMAAVTDILPKVIKIGALGSLAMVQTVIRLLNEKPLHGLPVILDTVLQSSSGAPLLAPAALEVFQEQLLPLATVITPNLDEFVWLAKINLDPELDNSAAKNHGFDSSAFLELALRTFASKLTGAVLLKGGHLPGLPIDRLYYQGEITSFSQTRITTRNTHGTGCVLASALASRVAQGFPLKEAVALAKAYLTQTLRQAPGLGKGKGPLGLRIDPNH